METKSAITLMILVLLLLGGVAIVLAVHFGKQYQAGGGKNKKYLCVVCCVFSCVCIVTAIQILFMFRPLLFAAA